MTKRSRIALGAITIALLAPLAGVVLAAPAAPAPRKLHYVCARVHTGLLRYVAQASDCQSGETALELPQAGPLHACVSTQMQVATAAVAGRRRGVPIPIGTLWRSDTLASCAPLHQQPIVLAGSASVQLCAARDDGLLRDAFGGACRRDELAVLVPPHEPTVNTPKPSTPVPPSSPVTPSPTISTPSTTPALSTTSTTPTVPTPPITPPATPPAALAQSIETDEGSSVAITLAATSGSSGEPLSYAIASQPAHGTLSGTPPALTYTPAAGYHGDDQFTFTVGQGSQNSAPATVAIVVNQVNQPPVLTLPLSQTVAENGSLVFSSVGGDRLGVADADADGGVERVGLKVGHGTLALAGTSGLSASTGDETSEVTLEGTIAALEGALEAVTYTPAHDYSGADALDVTADDLGHTGLGGARTTTGSVPITVSPVVYDHAEDDSYTVLEDETLNVAAPGVLGNDSDSEGLPLSAVLVSGPTHGSLTLNADGSFSYTPASGYSGADSFTYEDDDGNSDSNTATVAIAVEHVNQPPVLTLPLSQTLAENGSLVFSNVGGNRLNVADADSEGGVERVRLAARHGALTFGDTTGLTAVAGTGTAEVTMEGTIAALEGALEAVTYTPAHDYVGADTLEVTADDLGHTGAGGAKTVTGSVPITVTPVVYDHAEDDSYTAVEDKALTVPKASGVLANDSDSDMPPLPLSAALATAPAHGTVTLNSDGSFVYTPEHLFTGTDSFTYRDYDGNTESNTATVTIQVTGQVYDHAEDDSYTVLEDETLNVAAPGVLGNDSDSEGLPLSAVLVSGPAHGSLTLNADGSFSYTPASGYSGADSFTYEDDDGNSDSNTATVAIAVEHVDRAPVNTVPGAQTVLGGGSLVFSAADGDAISVSDVDADGGEEQVTLSAKHGALTPGGTSGLSVHSGAGTGRLVLEGTIAALDDALEGLTYRAEASYGGADTLTLETDDLGHTGAGGPLTSTSTISIKVEHVNEPPTVTVPGAQTTASGEALVFSSAKSDAIVVGDPDADGGTERVQLKVAHGTLTLAITTGLSKVTGNESGEVTIEGTLATLNNALNGLRYTSTGGYEGADELEVAIDDLGHTGAGGAKTASADVAITVASPAPTPTNPTYTGAVGNTELSVGVSGITTPDVARSGSVLPEPPEEHGAKLSVAEETITSTQGATVHMKSNGTFTYVPKVGFDGSNDTFHYTEKTSRGGEATGTVTIDFDKARVWYVNDSASSEGNGESTSPFKGVSAATSASAAGDTIFLYGGGATYTGGVTLKADQTLAGESQGLEIEGEELAAPTGSNPTITNSAGNGVTVESGDVLRGITVSNSSADGVYGSNTDGLTLEHVTASDDDTSTNANDSNVRGEGLSGTVKIASSFISGAPDDNATLTSASSGTLDLDVTASTFGPKGTSSGDDGLRVIARGAGVDADVTGSTFTGNSASGLEVEELGVGSLEATVEKNTVTDNAGTGVRVAGEASGPVTFDVHENKLTGQQGNAIDVYADSSDRMVGQVTNNSVGSASEADSGSVIDSGIRLEVNGSATMTANVSENTIQQIKTEDGIRADAAEGSGTLNLTLAKNDVHTDQVTSQEGLYVDSGADTSDTTTVCLHTQENTAVSAGTEAGNELYGTYGLVVIQNTPSSKFEIQGYDGNGADESAIESLLVSQNTLLQGSEGAAFADVESGPGFTPFSGTCPTAP